MLRKLTKPNCKKKREFHERSARLDCTPNCDIACIAEMTLMADLYAQLEWHG
jgi:hypothetical protein